MKYSPRQWRRLRSGLLFLVPNITGFMLFTLVPLVLSFVLAFTNWDVRRHNIFKTEQLEFIGFQNFERLFSHPAFWQYLGNTLFLMLGIPFAIGGSLVAALLLTGEGKKKPALRIALAIASGLLIFSLTTLLILGFEFSGIQVLIGLLFLSILTAGLIGGTTVYRTIFYAPHFTAGVATFLLWKKMYNPQTGPINNALSPILSTIENAFRFLPPASGLILGTLAILLAVLPLVLLHRKIVRARLDAEIGRGVLFGLTGASTIPLVLGWRWLDTSWQAPLLIVPALVSLGWVFFSSVRHRPFRMVPSRYGLMPFILPLCGAVSVSLISIGLSVVAIRLPGMAESGLNPPNWLADYHWAKPAIMIMAFWAAVGSNNMILYIAGLTNIPRELYDAADIDGASRLQRFWNVTWPQLAPVTFFISIMSVIHGLQGGFEMARTMTQGGPAGATTTLSYFVFIEGFETGRLGYASAVVWALFVLVMTVTLINFKFGNRYVND